MKEVTLTFTADITNSFVTEDDNLLVIMDKQYVPAMETMLAQAIGLDQVQIKNFKVFMQEVKEDEPVD